MSEEESPRQIAHGSYIAQALGEGAVARIDVHLPPTPRTPLQRPPRAEHFTGREKELAKLLDDLHLGSVITLTGSGGIGKTALAAEAIWTLAPGDDPPERFPDGILFHSFYNQARADLALEKIALAYGEEPRPTPKDAAQRALAGRRALLVLDSAENTDDLPSILEVRDRCCVLITSRSRRDAPAERQDIQALPLEEGAQLLQAWAGDRAKDRAVVEEICKLVGRLPLALRLVGRYLYQQSEEAVEYFSWLQKSPLKALDLGKRQEESVPLLLKQSMEQVDELSQRVLSIAGMFAMAPFDRSAIAAAFDMAEGELRPALAELVNYGLLLRREGRYEMSHPLIRTFVQTHQPPSIQVFGNLAGHYLLAAHSQSERGKDGYEWFDANKPHLLNVVALGLENREWEIVRLMAGVLDKYLDFRGHFGERILISNAGREASKNLENRQGEAFFLTKLGNTYRSLGQVQQALECYEEARDIYRETGIEEAVGTLLGNLANVYLISGQVDRAIEYYQDALQVARRFDDKPGEGRHLGNLGNIFLNDGHFEEAIEYYEKARAISHESGELLAEADTLGNLGTAYVGLGQVDQGIEYYQNSLNLYREIGYQKGEGTTLANIGSIYDRLGRSKEAIAYYEPSVELLIKTGNWLRARLILENLAEIYSTSGLMEQAVENYEKALLIHRQIGGGREEEGIILQDLGYTLFQLKQFPRTIKVLEEALVIDREIEDLTQEGRDLYILGISYGVLEQVEKARDYLKQALAKLEEMGQPEAEEVRKLLKDLSK